MPEFDRLKTITDYLSALTDLEISDMTELDAAPRPGWEAVVRSVRGDVVTEYGNGNVNTQDVWHTAWGIADGLVPRGDERLVSHFAIVKAAHRVWQSDVSFSGAKDAMAVLRLVLGEVYGTAVHRLVSAAEAHADEAEYEHDAAEEAAGAAALV